MSDGGQDLPMRRNNVWRNGLAPIVEYSVKVTLQWDNNFIDVTIKLQQNLKTTKN